MAFWMGCSTAVGMQTGVTPHNILLIIADDFSTDGLRLYHTNEGFYVSAQHVEGVRCFLYPNLDPINPVWSLLTNAAVTKLSSTNSRLTDPTQPAMSMFYRVGIQSSGTSTHFTGNWHETDWD